MKKAIGIGIITVLLAASVLWAKVGGGDIVFRMKGAAEAVFSHDAHVAGKGLRCTNCHYALYATVEKHSKATMADMQKGRSCGACHNGQNAFDVKTSCDRCHKK